MFKPLFLVFFGLLLLIGGSERGTISAITIIGNLFVLFAMLIGIFCGISPIIVTFFGCIIIVSITIFYQNGKSEKTLAAFIAVIIILLLLFFIIYFIGEKNSAGGLNEIDKFDDELMGYSLDIDINMRSLVHSIVVIWLLGAITDTAVAISSAIYEVFINNRQLTMSELFLSGISIGKDILGTTINTLYFAFIGEGLMLFIWYQSNNYSFINILNSKSFFQEFEYLMFSCIGCILIIPTTAILTSYILTHKK